MREEEAQRKASVWPREGEAGMAKRFGRVKRFGRAIREGEEIREGDGPPEPGIAD